MPARINYFSVVVALFSAFLRMKQADEQTSSRAKILLTDFFATTKSTAYWNSRTLDLFLRSKTNLGEYDQSVVEIVHDWLQKFPPHQTNVVLHHYLLALKADHCSPSTIKNYRSDIGQFLQFVSESDLSSVFQKPKIVNFILNQRQKGLKLSSIRRKLISMTQFVLWAERFGYLPGTEISDEVVQLGKDLENANWNDPKIGNSENSPAKNSETTNPDYKFWTIPLGSISHADLEFTTLGLTSHNLQTSQTEVIFGNTSSGRNQIKPPQTGSALKSSGLKNSALKDQELRTRLRQNLRSISNRFGSTNKPKLQIINAWMPYVNLLLMLLFLVGGAVLAYRQFGQDAENPLAYPNSLTRPNRTLSFQGRLTDTAKNPITVASDMRFRLYDSGPGIGSGNILWDSGACSVTPDQDGIFSTGLGDECGSEITDGVFTENSNVWLQVEVNNGVSWEILDPRQSIKTVPYALNSETVQGYPASASAVENTILVMDNNGDVVLGSASPTLRSTGSSFTIEAQTLTLQTSSGSDGDIILSPDGVGEVLVNSDLSANGYISAPGATLSANYVGGKPLVVQGLAGHTANLTEWSDGDGNVTVIDENGNVGIGTTSPGASTHIYKSAEGVGLILETNDGTNNGQFDIATNRSDNGLRIYTGSNYGSGGPAFQFWGDTSQYKGMYFDAGTVSGSDIFFRSSPSGSTAMTIKQSSGNVGIGTTAPTEKLHVVGGIRLTGALKDVNNQVGTAGQILSSTGTGVDWIDPSSFTDNYADSLSFNTGDGVLTLGRTGALPDLTASLDGRYLTSYTETDPVWTSQEPNYFNLTQNETVTGIPAFNGGTTGSTAPFTVDSTYLVTNLNAEYLNGISSGSFLRSDTSDDFTSGTLGLNSGTTLDVNGDISIADTDIALDGASTNLSVTGNFSINTDDLFINKSTGNVGIGDVTPDALLDLTNTTEQLRLSYDTGDTNFASFTLNSSGDLTIAPSGGDINISGALDVSSKIAVGDATITTDQIAQLRDTNIPVDGTNTTYGINLDQTLSSGGVGHSATQYGISSILRDSSTNSGNNSLYGIYSHVINENSSKGGNSGLSSVRGHFNNTASAILNQLRNIYSFTNWGGTGLLNNGKSFSSRIEVSSTGSVTNFAHFSADSPTNISGTINSISGLNISDQAVGNTTTAYGIYIGAQSGATNDYGIWGDDGDWILDEDGGGAMGTDGGGDLMLGEGQDLKLYHNGTDSYISNSTGDLILNSTGDVVLQSASGNVGIGTTSPSYKLDVSGTGRFTGAVDLDGDLELNSTLTDITGSVGTSGQILSSTGTGVDWIDAPSGGGSQTLAQVLAVGNSAGSYSIDMNNNLITNIGNAGTDFTSGGGLTLASTLTASNGLTLTTGALNLTATSGTLSLSGLSASSISTGANALTVTSSNFNTTATGINSTAIGATTPSTGAFTTLSSTGATTLGNNSANVTINSNIWDITGAGVASGLTGLSSSGTVTFSGLTADRLISTTTGGQLTTSISSANAALSISDETGSGLMVFNNAPTFSTGSVSFSGITSDITTPGNEHFSIMPGGTGNVGIGTTNPGQKLEVVGRGKFGISTNNSYVSMGNATDGSFPGIWFGANTTNPTISNYAFLYDGTPLITAINTPTNGMIQFRVNNDYNNALTFDKNKNLTIGGAYTYLANQKLDVLGGAYISGNVGIGTTSPSYKIDVSGTGRFTGAVDLDGDLELNSTLTDVNGSVGTSGQVLSSTATGVDWIDLSTFSDTDDQTLAEVLGYGNSAGAYSIDMNSQLITNIGAAGTDFTAGGGLTLAGDLVANGNLSIADTDIALDGATANLNSTGNFSINTDDLFIEKSSGNVGIGTTGPTAKTQIVSSIDGGVGLIVKQGNNNWSNLQQWKNSSDTTMVSINSTGAVGINGGAGAWASKLYVSGTTVSLKMYAEYGGTVSLPSFAFANDTDTGIWRSAENILNFSTGGEERVRIDDTGNVGIGSTTPGYKLDVAGTGHFTGAVDLDGDLELNSTLTDVNGSVGSAGEILSSTATGTDWIAVSTLSVGNADTLDSLDSLQFLRSDTSDDFTSGTLGINSGATLDVKSGATLDINGDLAIGDTDIALDGASTNLAATGNFSINTDDIFVDKASGNVGIGTTGTTYKLQVAGTGEFNSDYSRPVGIYASGSYVGMYGFSQTNGSPAWGFGADAYTTGSGNISSSIGGWGTYSHDGTGTLTKGAGLQAYSPYYNSGNITNSIGVEIQNFGFASNVQNVYGLKIDNQTAGSVSTFSIHTGTAPSYFGGNVGIGSTTPGYKLDVAGTGHFTGAVDLDGDLELNSTLTDVNGSVGTNGQILSSTSTGVDWIDAPTGGSQSLAQVLAIGNSAGTYSIDMNNQLITNIGAAGTDFTAGGGLTLAGDLDLSGTASSSSTLSFRGTTDPKINVLNGESFGIATSVGGDAGLTERLTILNNGNVGVGTSTPSHRLDVTGSATSTTHVARVNRGGGDWDGKIFVVTSGENELFYVRNNGVVVPTTQGMAIGHTSPNANYLLHITGAKTALNSSPTSLRVSASLTTPDTGANYNMYGTYLGGTYTTQATGTIGLVTSAYIARSTVQNGGVTPTTASTLFINGGMNGASDNYAMYVDGGTAKSYFAGRLGIGDTTPASPLTVGNGDLFQVDSSGDMIKIKNVSYSWPSAQAGGAGYVLTNNGSGTLSWSAPTGVADDSLDFDKFQDTLDLDANLILNQGSFTWTQNFTGTTTTGLTYNANSLTSGTAISASSSSLSSGSLMNLAVTGTAAASNTQKVLNITNSGANATSTQTTYGVYSTNTRTGTGSTNVGGYFSASGGANNYAAIFANGNVGIGTTTPSQKLDTTGMIVTHSAPAPTFAGNGSIIASGSNISSSLGVLMGVNIPYVTGSFGGQILGYSNDTAPKWLIGMSRNASNEDGLYYFEDSSVAQARLAILPGGNVGIGTTAPLAKLDIEGSASASGTLTFKGTTDPKINVLNGESFGIATSVGGDAGLTERLTILNNGNVGIQNINPAYALDVGVQGNVAQIVASSTDCGNALGIRRHNNGTIVWLANCSGGLHTSSHFTAANFYTSGVLRRTGGSKETITITSNTGGGAIIQGVATDVQTLLIKGVASQTSNLQTWQNSAGTSLAVLDINGNLGIGTTSPGSTLDVGGNLMVNSSGNIIRISGQANANLNNHTLNLLNNGGTVTVRNNSSSTGSSIKIESGSAAGSNIYLTGKKSFIESDENDVGLVVKNSNTSSSANGMSIQIATSGTGTGGNQFIRFINNSGTQIGRVRYGANTTSVVYATTGTGDFAEWVIGEEPTQPGDIIAFQGSSFGKADQGERIAGVYSTYGAFVAGEANASHPNATMLALSGITKMKVNTSNGSINNGDPITVSNTSGVGMKATKSGQIVAKAMENYSNSNPNTTGMIHVLLNVGWYNTGENDKYVLKLNEAGQVVLNTDSENYKVTVRGSVADNLYAVASIISAKVQAGLVTTKDLVAQTAQIGDLSLNSLTIAGQPIRDYIAGIVTEITQDSEENQLAGESLIEDGSGETDGGGETDDSGENQDSNTSHLSELLVDGSATVSGTLTADVIESNTSFLGELNAQSATISGDLVVEDVYAATISAHSSRLAMLEARTAEFEKIKADTADLMVATVSGTLYADNIYDFENKIANSFEQPGLIDILKQKLGTENQNQNQDEDEDEPPATQEDVYDSLDQGGYEATSSADLDLELSDLSLGVDDVTLTAQALFIDSYFKVNGVAYVADTLGIGNKVLIGQGTTIADGSINYTAPDGQEQIFEIQPSGRGTVSILAGLMTLTESGQVEINGDLKVAGDLTVEDTLLSNLIQPVDFGNPFQVQVAGISDSDQTVKESRFEIVNELGSPVATISAQGRASFADGIDIGSENLETDEENTTSTNKSSGKATIKAGSTGIIIETDRITEDTLVYVTPVGSTDNKVLYVKSQRAHDPENSEQGRFVVGFDQITTKEVQFNWWLVN